MKRIDMIDACQGVGKIYRDSGEFVRDAEYDLRILQEVHETPREDLPGLEQIEGTVELHEMDLMLVGEPLVLHLEDGRHLDFLYVDDRGVIASRGGKGIRSQGA